MSRRISRITCSIVSVVIVAASASSCVANDGSILIIGILAPPTSSGTGATAVCTYTADIMGPFLSFGTVDFAFTRQYIPELLLGNQLVPQANGSIDRLETDNINIEGAIVTVTDEGTGEQLDNYTVLGAGFLQPSSGGEPGIGTYATTMVSPKVADALGVFTGTKRLISNVEVYGTTSGGTYLKSAQIPFEINACFGCLVVFSTAADDPASPIQPNCDASTTSGSTTITPPCVFGQDQAIDCQLCAGTGAPYSPTVNVCEP
jgi:hypothetical protein